VVVLAVSEGAERGSVEGSTCGSLDETPLSLSHAHTHTHTGMYKQQAGRQAGTSRDARKAGPSTLICVQEGILIVAHRTTRVRE
jgi:sRNA-binding protein